MFGIATPSGGIELVGLHVPCPGRGSVFVQPADALNVLYGRNGAGKTSILDGVRKLVNGTSDGQGAVAVFKLSPSIIESVFGHLDFGWPVADSTCHSLPPNHNRLVVDHRISFWLDEFGTFEAPSASLVEERLANVLDADVVEAYRSRTLTLASLHEDASDLAGEVTVLRLMAALASMTMELEPVNPNEDTQESWPLWYLSQLRRALAANLEMPKPIDDVFEAPQGLGSHAMMTAFFEALDVQAPAVDLDELDVGDLRYNDWDDLVRLLVYRDILAATRESMRPWEPGMVLEDRIGDVLTSFVESRMVAIQSAGSTARPSWRVRLVADTFDASSTLREVAAKRYESSYSEVSTFDFTRVRRLASKIADSEQVVSTTWQELGETYAALEPEQRSELETMGGRSVKRRMLFVYRTALQASPEERDAIIAEGRHWAIHGDESPDDSDEPTAVNDIGQQASAAAEDAERSTPDAASQVSETILRLLVQSTVADGRYALSDVGFTTTAFPWASCDLDDCPDPKVTMQDAFRGALRAGPLTAGTFVDYDDDDEEKLDQQLESEAVSELQARVDRAGARLAQLGLGVAGLRLRVSADIREWLDRGPVSFEALDAPSQRWVDVDKLSSAQQLWVARVLHLEHSLEGGFPLLVLADEPETGVHTTAAHAVLKLLESCGVTSLVATHATAAFRLPDANLMLVDRDFSGAVVLGAPGTGDDVQVAAVRMGTTPLELLAMKRLLVYVEGAHDEAVVEAVIAQSADGGLKDRVIVAPARGVRQFGGVASSVLLTEFTDLHTLVVADNARTTALEEAKAEAQTMLRDGLDAPTVKRRLRLSDRAGGSFEERVLWDLLERCIDRHVLHRVHFHGLAVGDIVETLPHTSFGLTEPWPALRSQYPGLRGEDFKAWLKREKSASISVRTIRSALASLDALSGDLVALLAAVEAADAAARVR